MLERASNAGVSHIVVTGTSLRVSQQAAALAAKYPSLLSSTAGVHPHDAKSWDKTTAPALRSLLAQSQVVAVGECGLDFNRNFSTPKDQEACFQAQLELACEVQKPVFLHERDAYSRFYEILRDYQSQLTNSVVHCFTGSREALISYLELGCFIGITGWVCDQRRGQNLRELIPLIPTERLLIETDAPFLTPHNLPKKPDGNRNEPAFLGAVLSQLADLYAMDSAELAQITQANSQSFFNLS